MGNLQTYLRQLPRRIFTGGKSLWPIVVFAGIILAMVATGVLGNDPASGIPWIVLALICALLVDFCLWRREQ